MMRVKIIDIRYQCIKYGKGTREVKTHEYNRCPIKNIEVIQRLIFPSCEHISLASSITSIMIIILGKLTVELLLHQ
jgi:hypothetical protein